MTTPPFTVFARRRNTCMCVCLRVSVCIILPTLNNKKLARFAHRQNADCVCLPTNRHSRVYTGSIGSFVVCTSYLHFNSFTLGESPRRCSGARRIANYIPTVYTVVCSRVRPPVRKRRRDGPARKGMGK